MHIPETIEVLTNGLHADQWNLTPRIREALKVALLCLKATHQPPPHAVLCENPELAKAIYQDITILNQLAFAGALTLNDDLKSASKHGSRALNSLRIMAEDPTYRIRLDFLYE